MSGFLRRFGLMPLVILLVSGCVETSATQRFTLALRVQIAPDVQATSVQLVPGQIRLHRVGTPRSAGWTGETLNDKDWVPLSSTNSSVELITSDPSELIPITDGWVPPGEYDHLFLEIESLQAFDAKGEAVPCKNVIEPIALQMNVQQGKDVSVVLELFIAANWPEEGHCSVLAKEAALVKEPAFSP